jgi:hypothetical protein
MPHQWDELPSAEVSSISHDLNHRSCTQQTSNTTNANHNNTIHHTFLASQHPTVPTSPNNNHIINHSFSTPITHHQQSTHSPNNQQFNQQFGCRAVLALHKSSCKTKAEYFKLLYCMYTGCDGMARNRINALVQHKHSTVSIRSIKPVKKEYVNELFRRFSYLMLKERGVLGFHKKTFRPTNKSQDELNTLFNSSHFRLPTGEKLYLEFEMEEYLSYHENELQLKLDELIQQGSEISRSDLRRMRLWEAFFLDTQYM